MNNLSLLMDGFATILTWNHLMIMVIGVMLGMLVGVLAAGPVLSAVEVFWDWLVATSSAVSGGTMDLAGAGSAMNSQAAAPSDGLIHASFPDGPMGFGICEKNGRFVVTKSSGVAMEQGVEVNDEVVQIGTVVLADKFKDVENDQRFNEVSRMIGTFPRPLTIVFAKPPGGDVESMHSIRSLSGDRPPSLVVRSSLDQK